MFNKNFSYIMLICVSHTILSMDTIPRQLQTTAHAQYQNNFSFTPQDVLVSSKQILLKSAILKDTHPEINLSYAHKYNYLKLMNTPNGERFFQHSSGNTNHEVINDFLKKLEEIATNNPSLEHITVNLFTDDIDDKDIEIFHLTMSSIKQTLSDVNKAYTIPPRKNIDVTILPQNSNDQPITRDRCDDDDDSSTLDNVLEEDFSVTFFCTKDSHQEDKPISVSFNNYSLFFTALDKSEYVCNTWNNIAIVLNSLNQLIKNNPEAKNIMVNFHDITKKQFSSNTYQLSVTDVDTIIEQFNTTLPKRFEQKIINTPDEKPQPINTTLPKQSEQKIINTPDKKPQPKSWQNIVADKYVALGILGIAAALAVLCYKYRQFLLP